jgi:NhaA family Na+:H+ antiporter
LVDPVSFGIIAGLVLGKQAGIFVFTWIVVKAGLANLPAGVRWGHLYGVSILAGIGFTMSLFIGDLAFEDQALWDSAKLGILAASIVSGIFGYAVLREVTSSEEGDIKNGKV